MATSKVILPKIEEDHSSIASKSETWLGSGGDHMPTKKAATQRTNQK